MTYISDSPDNFLTMAEKQKIIFRELENIRATETDEHVPGYEFIKLYAGRTVGMAADDNDSLLLSETLTFTIKILLYFHN